MTEGDIERNITALAAVGISAKRDLFDTTLLAQI